MNRYRSIGIETRKRCNTIYPLKNVKEKERKNKRVEPKGKRMSNPEKAENFHCGTSPICHRPKMDLDRGKHSKICAIIHLFSFTKKYLLLKDNVHSLWKEDNGLSIPDTYPIT